MRFALVAFAAAALAGASGSDMLRFELKEVYGEKGISRGELKRPTDVGVLSTGELAVLDERREAVTLFSPSGRWVRTIDPRSSGTGLRRPTALAVDREDRIWVSDGGNDRLAVVDASGALLQTIGSLGTAEGRFREPLDLACDNRGRVYVADSGNERIQVFRADGTVAAVWDRRTGGRRPHLGTPIALAYSDQGSGGIWVVNRGSLRVERFDLSGKWEEALDLAAALGPVASVDRLEIEPTFYRMFVADSRQNRVWVLSKRGELEGSIELEGERSQIRGIFVTRGLDVFIADGPGARVLQFRRE